MRYGEFEIHALPEGRFAVYEDGRFVPHPGEAPMPPGTNPVSVTPFLVKTPAEVLLLDTGLGPFAEGRDVRFLLEGLRRHGVEREDVTRVLLSHLHFDHLGAALLEAGGTEQPTFPHADYVVQRSEIEAPYTGTSEAARARILPVLEAAGQLALVEGDGFLTDEIEYLHTGGHTRGHQAFRLHTGGRAALFGGDVLPAPGHVTRAFRAKYDEDPARSLAERQRLVREAVEGGHLLLLYHAPADPAAFVEEDPRRGFVLERVRM